MNQQHPDRRGWLKHAAGATALALTGSAVRGDDTVAVKKRVQQSIVQWCYQKYWKIDEMCQVAKKLGCELSDIVVDDRLYAVEADDLLDVIHAVGDKLKTVMLFGHNPELTELGHRLSTEITHMPTCAIAEFTFDAKSWLNIGKVKPVQVTLDYPKRS